MNAPQIKVVGSNGQISLGKGCAGKSVLIDQVAPGTWVIKSGTFTPDSEQWLYQSQTSAKLESALAWNQANPPRDSFDAFTQENKNDAY